jgi:hypothetical protein
MRHKNAATFVLILIAIFWAPSTTHGQVRSSPPLRLDVTRDAWVSEVGAEADGNNGGATRLKLKSIQEMSLIDIDPRPLVGRMIRAAVLHLKKAGDERLERVTVSGVGAEWFEGTGSGYAVQAGGATFRHRRHPDLPWSIGGGDLCNVILGNGGTLWAMADASPPDAQGWQHIPVDPRVVAARVAGLSHGFLLFDDTGSEWTRAGEKFALRLFPNRFVYSREQNAASAPYFTIEPGPEDLRPPVAPSGIRVEPTTALLPAGEALVTWLTPRDDGPAGILGFAVTLDGRTIPHELVPLAAGPGERVEMHLRDMKLAARAQRKLTIQGVDGAGNRGPAATAMITVSSRIAGPLPEPERLPAAAANVAAIALPQLAGIEVAVVDELDKTDPRTGELIPTEPGGYMANNHLWSAADGRIRLQAARNEFVAFQVSLRSPIPTSEIQPTLVFDGPDANAIKVEFGRYHHVATSIGPVPDPIVPLSFPANGTPAIKSQSLHVEIYVPHTMPPGIHHGVLTLTQPRAQGSLRLPVDVRVWDFTLPDHLSFLPEMNCYGLPENERAYYRLAHRHRTVLNRVPYSQSGQVQEGCAPRWDKERLDFDWSDWDGRFGPLLDGSAFADLPRKGVPLDRFYLPLHENWPSPMDGNFHGDYWADRAFPEAYHRAFVAAARQIAVHIGAKGWSETLFEGFLNNKNNFKSRGWSRGSSPWLLDEPANFQDFWALRYFARAFHEGINQAAGANAQRAAISPRLVFRADISRPQWRRDSLDGLLDDHVVGSAMRRYPRLVFERKRALGEIVLEYGSTNPVEGSNIQPAAWCLDVWSLGADGVIPWQTVGNADSWRQADALSLFYPARAGGSQQGDPIPSIRLKAYRRGQQDVEYLTLWSHVANEPRWAVGQQVRAVLKLTGTRQGTGFSGGEDAGRIDFGQLRARDLWVLRTAIGEALSRAHPVPKAKLVDFRTPRREPGRLPPKFVGAIADQD